MIIVAVDDGHGKGTPGKRTPKFSDGSYMEENAFNRAVAAYVCALLETVGIRPLPVAPEEEDVPLRQRVERANAANADIYVSIHANAFGEEWNDANGVETWVRKGANGQTMDLAKKIHQGLQGAVKRKDRGVLQTENLYVLNQTKMPAVLVECGFMTNTEEAVLLRTDAYRRLCAQGIFSGICNYFKIEIEGEEEMKRYQRIEELPYGKEVIRKLVEKRVLVGDKEGNLNISEDMLRILVVLDRAAIL